jgi:hypothetical protein
MIGVVVPRVRLSLPSDGFMPLETNEACPAKHQTNK